MLLTQAIDAADPDRVAEYLNAALRVAMGDQVIAGGSNEVVKIIRNRFSRVGPFRSHSQVRRNILPGPMCIDNKNGYGLSSLTRAAAWPYSKIGTGKNKFQRVISGTKVRIVSNATLFAKSDNVTCEEAMDHVHDICQTYRLGVCHSPAQLAWRLLRHHLHANLKPLPDFPDDGIHRWCLEAEDNGPYILPAKPDERMSYKYDKNCAYGYYLARVPNLGTGRWRTEKSYKGPYGIYRDRRGDVRGGFSVAQDPAAQRDVQSGYVWDGDPFLDSPFRRFVTLCYTWAGPLSKMMRRCPVYVCGKAWRHKLDRHTGVMTTGATWYPILWLWPVGGLHEEMRQLCAKYGGKWAWVDNLRLKNPLPESMLGSDIGQFRFEGVYNAAIS